MIAIENLINTKQPRVGIPPIFQFSLALFRANLRDLKGLAVTLGMPLFMLFTIWELFRGFFRTVKRVDLDQK